jgi:PAS domain S-box-containing protein
VEVHRPFRRSISDWPLRSQFALSLALVAIALVARALLAPVMGERFPMITLFLVLFPLVLLVRPGPFLVAVLVGWVGAWFFFVPTLFSFRGGWLTASLFLLSAVLAALTAWLSRRARARTLTSDAMVRAFVDESPTCKWVTDVDGRIVYVNQAMAQLIGKPITSILGRTHAEVMPPQYADIATEHIRSVRESGDPSVTVEEIGSSDSAQANRFMEWRRFVLSGANGNPELVAGMANDVTEKRQTERALERLLASERAARAEAERATRVKDEFLATLSHELRTPLNAILGWVRLIERNPANDKLLSEGIPVIARNAKVQMDLIADLLDTNRIISGKVGLELQTLDVAQVVASAIQAIRPSASARGVRIEFVVEPFTERILGDENRLQQVVWNLLSNAVKFSPAGGRVQVTVRKAGAMVQIVVIDEGAGIDPAFVPHLFEKFTQADASTSRKFVGLGLGLSIVKHLVELHGGTVRADSGGEGKGATFTVELPFAVPDALARGRRAAALIEMSDIAMEVDLAGVNVLAVEDQPDAADLLKRALEASGARVTTVASVDEALAALRHDPPDVVCCDIALPEKDGYEFIERLRASGDRTPAIAVTALARPEDVARALGAGYQAHASKPVDWPALISTIAVMARARRRDPPASAKEMRA